ncbi:MAG TPA: hydroxyisourate hydrolase, partial [Ramlibacter sp.]|nr:hydroxyisourate hydrolase [Ramlibacter sp.]
MGLSTHVLDTMHGGPAAGMAVELYAIEGDQARLVRQFRLSADGRPDGPLIADGALQPGRYRFVFD